MTIPPALLHTSGLLTLAVLLGGIVGLERERHDRPAGLRTHILVCLGSALITIVGNSSHEIGGRIAAQIVTGVGFLGAGTIMRVNSGGPVRGLTTAASLWVVAGVGIAVGYDGLYAQAACVTTLITLMTLTIMDNMEDFIDRRRRQEELTILFQPGPAIWDDIATVMNGIRDHNIKIGDFGCDSASGGQLLHFRVHFPRNKGKEDVDPILTSAKSVLHYNWRA
jgi:putative Mg2+ transporter-C (MgtC) family protein